MKEYESRISVIDVSKILDTSPQFVRMGLQQKRLPFGVAVQTSSEWTYHISQKLLEEYIGEEPIKRYFEKEKKEELN